jgi:hypothetical protein
LEAAAVGLAVKIAVCSRTTSAIFLPDRMHSEDKISNDSNRPHPIRPLF